MSQAGDTVLVNRPFSTLDTRYEYPHKLLTKVLNATECQYGKTTIKHSPLAMPRNRALIELEKGESIHVFAEAPKPNWETRLIPVRIPIRKGIQGFRTFLILKEIT